MVISAQAASKYTAGDIFRSNGRYMRSMASAMLTPRSKSAAKQP